MKHAEPVAKPDEVVPAPEVPKAVQSTVRNPAGVLCHVGPKGELVPVEQAVPADPSPEEKEV